MRRAAGLGALDRAQNARAQYQQVGDAIARQQIEELNERLQTFQQQLSRFAEAHARDINKNAAFRSLFCKMCATIGVDLLTSSTTRSAWSSSLLGNVVTDFYFEIATRIIEICRQTRGDNGGLIDLETVRSEINAVRKESVSRYQTQ